MSVFLCPVCGERLEENGKSLVCKNRHTYDVARSGYVNLLKVNDKHSACPGDNKEMIASRVRVMEKGYYDGLASAIAGKIGERAGVSVLDAGCGTGRLAHLLKTRLLEPEVIGTDISKPAIEKASKLYKDVTFAVCSSKNLPIGNGREDVVVCAFAPVYEEEFARVMKEDGLFFRVVPAKEHLYELKEYLYDVPRKNEEDETTYERFALTSTEIVESAFTGDREDVKALVRMTPYYYHTSEEILRKLDELDTLTTRTAFELRTYRKR